MVLCLLLKTCQGHKNYFQRVVDVSPPFANDLSTLFVAHAWKLGFYLSSGFSLVDAVGTNLFGCTLLAHVDSIENFFLFGLKLLFLNLNAFEAGMVLSEQLR